MAKILIVEDDQIVANIYRNKLALDGFQVEIAHDGEAALKMIQELRPDAVLLDLMLPRMTGIELMKTVRALPEGKDLAFVVLSNTYLTNMVQEAWRAGATKCLSKANCSPKQVIHVLRNVIGGAPAPAAPAPAPDAPAPRATPVPAARTVERAAAPADADAEFQAQLREEFLAGLPATLIALRSHLQTLFKSDSETVRLEQLHEIYRRVHAVTGSAGLVGLAQIAQTADALEALLKEIHEKPANINASTLRTVASAIDFLGYLFEHGTRPDQQQIPSARILVVDDEPISRRAVAYALEKAKLKSVSAEDGETALGLLEEGLFDLVFLDVDMPGMNGFELCTRLRAMPTHAKTPVVFVTSLNDFESRTNSTMSGGNDFIAKPFLFIELAVKALIYVLRGKLEAARRAGAYRSQPA